jgi:hypothetical protein
MRLGEEGRTRRVGLLLALAVLVMLIGSLGARPAEGDPRTVVAQSHGHAADAAASDSAHRVGSTVAGDLGVVNGVAARLTTLQARELQRIGLVLRWNGGVWTG